MDPLINYNCLPVRLKKAASAGCVNGVSVSCRPLAFLPLASLLNGGGILLVGISLTSLRLKDGAASELVGGASTTQPAWKGRPGVSGMGNADCTHKRMRKVTLCPSGNKENCLMRNSLTQLEPCRTSCRSAAIQPSFRTGCDKNPTVSLATLKSSTCCCKRVFW